MKLILIKMGKTFSTLKSEGIIRGGRRVCKAFFAMFRKVGSGDILFITGGVGDSALYRSYHVAEELETHGFKCSITVQDNPFIKRYARKFKIFIFHRVIFTPSVRKMIKEIKKQNKEIIFETDDLVFDPKYLKYMDYYKKMNALEKKLYQDGVGEEILKDTYVKACTTTTSFLAEKLKEKNKKVFIVPNKLSNKDLEIADNILKNKKFSNDNKINVGYFSGTKSHDRDFAVITDVITRAMEKYENVELFLAGPLNIENKLNKFKNRIVQLNYVPRNEHFKNISKININLAPLEIGNPFCESKSELKFFEAGILRVPTIASATQTFREAIEDGVDGFFADTPEEWVEKLGRLIENKNLREKMGEKARKKALEKYSNKNSANESYYEYLKSKL